MVTTHGYKIEDFKFLEMPKFMKGCVRPMVYSGVVTDKNKKTQVVYWDENGKCAAEAYNDYYIHPYELIKFLNNMILCLSKI